MTQNTERPALNARAAVLGAIAAATSASGFAAGVFWRQLEARGYHARNEAARYALCRLVIGNSPHDIHWYEGMAADAEEELITAVERAVFGGEAR